MKEAANDIPGLLVSLRLSAQQLSAAVHSEPEALVRAMGCIQAQDFAGAKWAIATRLTGQAEAGPGQLEARIDTAFQTGNIIRTHVLRPTWHFVAPEDLGWLVRLTAPRIKAGAAGARRQLGLDQAIFQKGNVLFRKALKGGRQLDRKELTLVMQEGGLRTDDIRMTHLLMEAELDGIICSGGLKGRQFTYTLVEDRVKTSRTLQREEAIAELAMRYFSTRGPATLADLAWWSGLTIADARLGLAAHRHRFDSIQWEGSVYWWLSSINTASARVGSLPAGTPAGKGTPLAPNLLHMLPAYDEFTIAYRDRSLILAEKYASRAGNGIFRPVILQDGMIAGTWQRALKKETVLITTDLFRKIGSRALKAGFAPYGRYLDRHVAFSAPNN